MHGGYPHHPLLDTPSAYEVVDLRLHLLDGEPFLDLTLRHRDSHALRRLRFLSPRDGKFWFEPVPAPCPHLYDVRGKGLGELTVLAADAEATAAGPLSFWAKDVVELPPTG